MKIKTHFGALIS